MLDKDIFQILNNVMLEPSSYIHPERIGSNLKIENKLEKNAFNQLLLFLFNLDIDHDDIDLNKLTRCFLRQWSHIPNIAYLIGCYALKKEIFKKRFFYKLPKYARNFILISSLSFENKDDFLFQGELCHEEILKIGFYHLKYWIDKLPKPIAQRVLLLFPTMDEFFNLKLVVTPLILILVMQYVKENKNSIKKQYH